MEGKGRWKGKKKKKLTDLEQRQQQREAMAKEANRWFVGGKRSLDSDDDFGIVVNGLNHQESSWRVRIGIVDDRREWESVSWMGIGIVEDRCQWESSKSLRSLRMGSSQMALRMASRMGSAFGGFWFMTTEVKERMDKMKKSREVYSQVFSNENFPSPMPPFSSQNVSLF